MIIIWIVLFGGFNMKTISKERAKKLIDAGAILVDMRSPVSFRDGHIEGAVNLLLKNFTNLLMKTERKVTIILYADTVENSDLKSGVTYAEQLGFTKVFVTDYTTLR